MQSVDRQRKSHVDIVGWVVAFHIRSHCSRIDILFQRFSIALQRCTYLGSSAMIRRAPGARLDRMAEGAVPTIR